MPTIDSQPIIQELIDAEGYYFEDPRAWAIYSYENAWGNKTYHVSYTPAEEDSMLSSPFVIRPVLLWNRLKGRVNVTQ